ncbi:hypothetical protein PsalN5692_03335 [Piscirickettsia salmonis]|uniref:hypothetical protein n=1 Tax=Piscirickettsia salmonis TaxID=1238 RepID=UPI0012B9EECC|nr:hypothetical protein [Piscirickettsia salmonis]QGP51842.1 hypothetical protein PsalN5692_03335 [Piscirickettsia salmonis]
MPSSRFDPQALIDIVTRYIETYSHDQKNPDPKNLDPKDPNYEYHRRYNIVKTL